MPRWLVRVALLLGLLALGVRAGFASAAFMAPGGAILGWSQLPQARCTLCHPPQVRTTPGQVLTPTSYAALLTQHLSLNDELGQMLLVQFAGQYPTPDAVQMLNDQGAGGVLYFAANIASASQISSLNAQVNQLASIPPLLAVDQEGGDVNRLLDLIGPLPAAADLKDPQAAYARGVQDASDLSTYGFNLNLAPVVDVGTANPQLGARTFGSTPERVETMAAAYLEGLQQGQITACVKHFPGLGDTTTDPHIGLPILTHSRQEWENIDLAPYRYLFQREDVRAIMVTHEMIPAVDSQLPSTLSPAIVQGVLRDELGYNGVIITDSLYMDAINARWSVPEASVLAVKAGADIIIGASDPASVQAIKDAFTQALTSGSLTKARIDTSVQRILALKIRMGLIPMPRQSQQSQQSQNPPAPVNDTPSSPVQMAQVPTWRVPD